MTCPKYFIAEPKKDHSWTGHLLCTFPIPPEPSLWGPWILLADTISHLWAPVHPSFFLPWALLEVAVQDGGSMLYLHLYNPEGGRHKMESASIPGGTQSWDTFWNAFQKIQVGQSISSSSRSPWITRFCVSIPSFPALCALYCTPFPQNKTTTHKFLSQAPLHGGTQVAEHYSYLVYVFLRNKYFIFSPTPNQIQSW